ncbi:MAG: hemerythrin family protein [Sedimentisphaerales bacterium]|nr:hemerythrin family protein [Sedimentisphaerales bacterium]
MKKIEWDKSLATGIKSIDYEHKMLIERLNAVIESIDKNQGEGTIAKTLDFMLDYTNFHFSNEEKFISSHGYPGLEYQQQQHREFKDSLNKIILDFQQDGAGKDIALQIKDFLFIWLKKHIMEVDHELAQYVKE